MAIKLDTVLNRRMFQILTMDTKPLRFLVGIAAILLGIGFLFAPANTANYVYMQELMNNTAWGWLFKIYGVISIISMFIRLNIWVSHVKTSVGMWLWTYIFLSFVVFDPDPFGASELLLTVPIFAEMMIFVDRIVRETIFKRRDNPYDT